MDNQQNQKPILIVSDNDSGQRVDNYLFKHRKKLDKSTCYKLMRKGQIRVNGKRIKPPHKLVTGDEVRMPPFVFFVETKELIVNAFDQKDLLQRVVFEDDNYLVLNKPAGLPVHKGTGHDLGVIEIMTSVEPYKEVQLAHRLDKDTSGCLLLAKNRQGLLVFQKAMKNNEVTKIYLAVLEGVISESIVVNEPVDTENRINGYRHVVVSQEGKSAVTQFTPVKPIGKNTLVQCHITQGRTHQIRVHAKHIGHPVLGDEVYGQKGAHFSRKLFLHAHKLSFNELQVLSPLPSAFD